MRHLIGRVTRRRSWRRWALAVLLLLGAPLGAGYWYLANPQRVARLASGLLTDMTGTDVRIDSARAAWDGSLELHGVRLGVPELPEEAQRLFTAEQVVIRHDLWSLLSGTFKARSLTFIEPTLHLTEIVDARDPSATRYNYMLLRDPDRTREREQRLPDELPEVFIRAGRAQFGQFEAGRYTLLGTLDLSGNLMQQADRPGSYFFSLRQDRQGRATGPELSGHFDLRGLNIAAKLEHFALESPQRLVLPSKLRRWWDLLEPVGTLPTVRFEYDPDPAMGVHAVLEVKDAALTLPFGEVNSRMTGVSGRFVVANETVTVTDLSGQIEGLRYTINGVVHGLGRDAPFKLAVRIDRFELPEQPHYVLAFPAEVQRQFKRFTPSGVFNLLVVVERRADGRVTYDGLAGVENARGQYAKFPYPLQDVTGELRFNNEVVEIVSLRGVGPTGARVVLRGQIAPPGDGAAVDIVVNAFDVPIDEVLAQTLGPQRRGIVDMLAHQPSLQRLTDQHLVQTAGQRAARTEQLNTLRRQLDDALAADTVDEHKVAALRLGVEQLQKLAAVPVFDLGGKTEITVFIKRPYGDKVKYDTKIHVQMKGLNLLFEHWPYPMTLTGGKLVIDPDGGVQVLDVEALGLDCGHGRTAGRIRGEVTFDPVTKTIVPDLRVTAASVPVDGLLIASVPAPQNEALRNVNLRGAFDAAGLIYRNDAGKIDFTVDAVIERGTARPNGGALELTELAGNVKIARGIVEIDKVTAHRGDGKIELNGQTRWVDGRAKFDLTVTGSNLAIEPALLDAAPPGQASVDRARGLFDEFKPVGVFDAELTLRAEPEPGRSPMEIVLRPRRVAFDLRGQRVTLDECAGKVWVSRDGVVLDQLAAKLGAARACASGSLRLGGAIAGELKLSLSGPDFDPAIGAVLPTGLRDALGGLALRGAFDMNDAGLFFDGAGGVRFEGVVALTAASARLGVPVTQITGDVAIRATRPAEQRWPSLDVRFDLQQVRVAERLVRSLKLRLRSTAEPRLLVVEDLKGACYGGAVVGAGTVDLADRGRYEVNLSLHDVAMDPFVHPRNDSFPRAVPQPAGQDKSDLATPPPSGKLSAALAVRGYPDDADSRQGRGSLEIRDAAMYELPLALAVLQIANLSWPSSRSFDRASASFLLDGDTVRFDIVRFEAPTVEIAGDGTMRYSTLALDLDLFTRNPASPNLGPLSDMFNVFKDELISIHVGGTLDQPQAKVQSFTGIKESWRSIFGAGPKLTDEPSPRQPPKAPVTEPKR